MTPLTRVYRGMGADQVRRSSKNLRLTDVTPPAPWSTLLRTISPPPQQLHGVKLARSDIRVLAHPACRCTVQDG
ncbi:hypothetical protein PAXRUDRAFT_829730 [Paxillus rubicundulus Ve08.2h10]|uniref:Uncharacterized protein n=1 Tax=Paxillus rubicundulus Ve08.2h10 TaxID=930991 RepID=A0A0D0DUF3_9AGAM|nr:hypothetical protein PAXRUDRAFT_829730 [Paxillus rubicundulus Ve08.2h10]